MSNKTSREEIIKTEVSQRLSDVESYFVQLYEDPTRDLLLSTNLKGKTLGTYASLIQFISTWSRVSSGNIRTYIRRESDSNTQLTNLCNEFHGVVAFYMASAKEILSRDGGFSAKKVAKTILDNKLALYKESSPKFRASYEQRGKAVMLASFDHTECEFPPYFYDHTLATGKSKIHSESTFRLLVQSILTILSRVELSKIKGAYGRHYRDDIHEKLGTVAKELIENTEWWAKSFYDSAKTYNPNIRGMLLQFDTHEWTKERVAVSDPMDRYIAQLKDETHNENQAANQKKSLGFFELSIFDSGPGLARRWLKKDFNLITISEEYEAVLTCLQENMSTDESGISMMRGYGLPNVLRTIGRRGFLKLRTGRLSLFRNFAALPLDESNEMTQKNFKFYNWSTGDLHITEMPIAEGCLFTIVYPFLY